jgi:hypothetical protein
MRAGVAGSCVKTRGAEALRARYWTLALDWRIRATAPVNAGCDTIDKTTYQQPESN